VIRDGSRGGGAGAGHGVQGALLVKPPARATAEGRPEDVVALDLHFRRDNPNDPAAGRPETALAAQARSEDLVGPTEDRPETTLDLLS
jgi:hypothetical protein